MHIKATNKLKQTIKLHLVTIFCMICLSILSIVIYCVDLFDLLFSRITCLVKDFALSHKNFNGGTHSKYNHQTYDLLNKINEQENDLAK